MVLSCRLPVAFPCSIALSHGIARKLRESLWHSSKESSLTKHPSGEAFPLNLLLLTEKDIRKDGLIQIDGRRAEHIHCILRAEEGDSIRCGMLNGRIGSAKLLKTERREALLEFSGPLATPSPEPLKLRFIIALPRPQSFKKTLHFLASSGIPEVWFIATERVEKSYWKSSAMNPENIQHEIQLGLEQGGGTIPPRLEFRSYFRSFAEKELPLFQKDSRALIAHPGEKAGICPHRMKEKVTVAVGPEGGFLPEEVKAFTDAGFEQVSFGPHILRVEFAVAFLAGRISE